MQRPRAALALALAAAAALSAGVPGVQAAGGGGLVCQNTLDDSFFNRCRRELPPGPLAALGHTVASFVAPMSLAVSGLAVLLALPALLLLHAGLLRSQLGQAAARFQRLHLGALAFLHRVSYTLALNVALYAVFRQHRPCKCGPAGGELVQVGSVYGMPSGDAMSGGVFGMLLISWAPMGGRRGLAWAAGLAVMVLKCTERMALGFHSLGQVLTGTSLGVALSVYSERAPQYFVLVDVAVQLALGIAFAFDHEAMRVGADSPVNIFSWWLWGVGLSLLVAALHLRFYHRRGWRGFRDDLRTSMDGVTAEDALPAGKGGAPLLGGDAVGRALHRLEASSPLSSCGEGDPPAAAASLRQAADTSFTLGAFGCACVVFYAAELFMVYGWGFGG